MGACSTTLTVLTDEVPTFMNPPTLVKVDYNLVSLTWNPITADADTGRDLPTYYKVMFLVKPCFANDVDSCTAQAGTWTEISEEATQKTNTTFDHISGDSTTHFSRNKDFSYKLCVKNGVGWGPCSNTLTILTDDYPIATTLNANNASATYNTVSINIATILDVDTVISGRSPITFYEFQWDNYQYSAYTSNLANLPWVTLP